MRGSHACWRGLALLLAAALAPRLAHGQEPITAAGLGYPVAPVDARAAALGSVGVGLLGGTFSLKNPADLTEHRAPGLNISTAPEGLTVKEIEGANTTGRQRLTVVRAAVPFSGWVVGFGFGAELDQDWSVTIADTAFLQTGTYPIEEVREHDGGISTIDLSLARRIGPLSLGVSGQRLTGSLRQSFRKSFDVPLEENAPILTDVSDATVTSYRAWRFKAGASVTVGDRVLIGGSYTWTGDLTADPQDPERENLTFDMPRAIDVGASARLGSRVLLAAGGGWANWSSLDSQLDRVTAYDVLWGGAGIEYSGVRILGLDWPLRLGARTAQLPFSPGDAPQAREVAAGLGLGVVFRGGLGELNLAFELGRRGDLDSDQIEETFRRLTVSFTLRQ